VDSNELAFKMAGIFAVKEACKKANLVLLEPIMKVEVVTPEVSQGDVMGDLNRRRGKILGMEMDSKQICTLTCEVPLAEMFGYATAVRSLSKGRASYSMEPFSFEQVPGNIAEEVISGSTKKPART
jgi:elongation factor G